MQRRSFLKKATVGLAAGASAVAAPATASVSKTVFIVVLMGASSDWREVRGDIISCCRPAR